MPAMTAVAAGDAGAAALAAQLDTVLAAVGQGVLVVAPDRRVLRINEPCRAILRLPPELATAGTPVADIARFCAQRGDYGPGDAEEQARALIALFDLNEPQSYDRSTPGGPAVTARSLPLPDGGVVITYTDETDYRHAVDDLHTAAATLEESVTDHAGDLERLTAALDVARHRAAEATRVKARTLALMNQELRIPVGGIVESVRALLTAPLGPQEQSHVSRILNSATALRLILDDLGDLARLEADEITLEAAPFSIETVVGSVLSAMAERAEETGLRLTGAVDTVVPELVTGDAAWLRHVLAELVALALRDTERGTIAVTVEPGLLPGMGLGVRFAVEGAGPEAVASLRTWLSDGPLPDDIAQTRRAGLRGLGLHICRRIVALMGGEMGASDAEERGTLWFTAALPACPQVSAGPCARSRCLKILVVEDNPVNQRVNTWLLEREGHCVTVVGDGAQAVRAASDHSFDAVLMDLDLPGLDGIAATRRIRALDGPAGGVPIIAITGSALPMDIERCREAGMNDHLPKPVNPAALVRALTRLTAGDGTGGAASADEVIDEVVLGALEGVIGRPTVVRLVAEFLERADAIGPELAAARRLLDIDALAGLAAELKGVAGSVGLTGVFETARLLDRLCRECRREEALDTAVLLARRLDQGCGRLRALWGAV
ncbi:response regulator [Azospirillum sp. RWY-5-1]|uniref:histidine kinase n=1 Tax=Azospirillum oleiclasticum TaxID=2735135 RepID=A0ABX2T3Y9_9PROT|nr:response regulator [Azospirillum oleiclasticum]NYZ11875.1 response regulator [Azospirillum oleiclasticum]NYZ19035.1 response regulator [Azospirillum oleiclasticum]